MDNQQIIRKSIKNVLLDGADVIYGPLSICHLGNVIPRREYLARKYQVEISKFGLEVSKIFVDIGDAIDSFLYLKVELDERANYKRQNRNVSKMSTKK